MVELMAIQVQRPHWFVSHAWIEPWIGKLSRLLETVLLHFVCQQQVTFPLIIHIPLEALVEFWTCSFRTLNRMLYQKEMNIERNDR